MSNVQADSTVKVHYTGKLEDGEVFDSSAGRDPIQFTLGTNHVIPGFESGVMNMSVGDKKKITIEPEDAYGPIIKKLVNQIPISNFPAEHLPEVGDQYKLKSENRKDMVVRVIKIEGDNVILDANHPLAGKKLIFELELVEIQ